MDHMKDKIIGIISLQTNMGFPNWDFHNPTICNPPLKRGPQISLWKETGPSQTPTQWDVLTNIKLASDCFYFYFFSLHILAF